MSIACSFPLHIPNDYMLCIFLIIVSFHVFIYHFSLLEKWLVLPNFNLFTCLFFFKFSFIVQLYVILDTNPFNKHISAFFPHILGFLFTFLTVSFWRINMHFSLTKSSLSVLSFLAYAFVSYSWNHCLIQILNICTQVFI